MKRFASLILVSVLLVPAGGCLIRTRGGGGRCRGGEYWDGNSCRSDRDRDRHDRRGDDHVRDHRR
jgi:hypothetical protein